MDPDATERALIGSEPRAETHAWRVLESDLPKVEGDRRLVPTGLYAREPAIDIFYVPGRDGIDAYASKKTIAELAKRFRPQVGSRTPNLLLRVPTQDWVLGHSSAPPAVVAADLLSHPDDRVARSGRRLLRDLIDAHRDT